MVIPSNQDIRKEVKLLTRLFTVMVIVGWVTVSVLPAHHGTGTMYGLVIALTVFTAVFVGVGKYMMHRINIAEKEAEQEFEDE